jgi:hypothetical protein
VTATVAAALVAGVILVVAVLPAEYGIDPLGTGRALGLTALSGTDAVDAPAPDPAAAEPLAKTPPLADDVYRVELRPFEGVEYKYRLEQGAALVYSWEASADVEFEFHGEPDGAPDKYFDSYVKGTARSGRGAFTATKAGIHGWYWKNHGAGRVTVTLRSAGFFAASTEYRDGETIRRTFPLEVGPAR